MSDEYVSDFSGGRYMIQAIEEAQFPKSANIQKR